MARLLGAASFFSVCCRTETSPPAIHVVDLQGSSTTLSTQVAVQTCAGLLNRDQSVSGAAFILLDDWDLPWLRDTEGIVNPDLTPPGDFVSHCLESVAKGVIPYNASSQQAILPNIITVAAVLGAVPIDIGDPHSGDAPVIFDALKEFAGFDGYAATEYVHRRFVNQTTNMCKMNPGLDVKDHIWHPTLANGFDARLVDFVVKERLFAFYLYTGCVPFTKDHGLMEKIVHENPWPRPIAVYGYDDTFQVAGDFFEAETLCTREHNMGAIASSGVNNLAFFSRKSSIETPLVQNSEPLTKYNKSKTYLTLIVGDGDNLSYLKRQRRDWMLERVLRCKADPSYKGCFPLVWTLSPHSLHAAPDWARWYFNVSYMTGHDYFALPPSGDLYAYPSEMSDSDQAAFIRNTERDCVLLNTSGSVVWEWFTTWGHAMKKYFPKYAERGIMRSGFAVNVPFDIPIPEFFRFFGHVEYKVLGDRFVLFRPREWRGTSKNASRIPFSGHESLTAEGMAALINKYPKGSVSHIYLTSDGGAKLQDFYDLVALLDEHVTVVPAGVATDMALAVAAQHDQEFVV